LIADRRAAGRREAQHAAHADADPLLERQAERHQVDAGRGLLEDRQPRPPRQYAGEFDALRSPPLSVLLVRVADRFPGPGRRGAGILGRIVDPCVDDADVGHHRAPEALRLLPRQRHAAAGVLVQRQRVDAIAGSLPPQPSSV
jgi:hypothetical protein